MSSPFLDAWESKSTYRLNNDHDMDECQNVLSCANENIFMYYHMETTSPCYNFEDYFF